jgi:hypothetical protein
MNREPQEFWFTGKIIGPQLRGISLASPQIQAGLSDIVTATAEGEDWDYYFELPEPPVFVPAGSAP